MGDPKLLTRLREFCEAYKVEYAFEGVIEGFDTIDYVDSERLTRGLFVRNEERKRLVLNEPKRKPPVKIGDNIIVVGRDRQCGEDSVLPAVLLNSSERYALFSEDIRDFRIREGSGFLLVIPSLVGLGLVTISILSFSVAFAWISALGWLIYIGSSFFNVFYLKDHLRRPRLYHCDEETWYALTGEVAERFGINPSA